MLSQRIFAREKQRAAKLCPSETNRAPNEDTRHICLAQTLNMCCVKARTLTLLADQKSEKQLVFATAELITIAASSSACLKVGGALKGRRRSACVRPTVHASVRSSVHTTFS